MPRELNGGESAVPWPGRTVARGISSTPLPPPSSATRTPSRDASSVMDVGMSTNVLKATACEGCVTEAEEWSRPAPEPSRPFTDAAEKCSTAGGWPDPSLRDVACSPCRPSPLSPRRFVCTSASAARPSSFVVASGTGKGACRPVGTEPDVERRFRRGRRGDRSGSDRLSAQKTASCTTYTLSC